MASNFLTPIKVSKRKYDTIVNSNEFSPSTNSICSFDSFDTSPSPPIPAIIPIHSHFSFKRKGQDQGKTQWGNQLGSPKTLSFSGFTIDWLQQAFRACIFYKHLVGALSVILEILSWQELPEFQYKSTGTNGHEAPMCKNITANFKHFIIDHIIPYISHKDSWSRISLIWAELKRWNIIDLNKNYITCYNLVHLLHGCMFNTFNINLTCWSEVQLNNINTFAIDKDLMIQSSKYLSLIDYEIIPIALGARSKSFLNFLYHMCIHNDKAVLFAFSFLDDNETDLSKFLTTIFDQRILSTYIKEDLMNPDLIHLSRFKCQSKESSQKYRLENNHHKSRMKAEQITRVALSNPERYTKGLEIKIEFENKKDYGKYIEKDGTITVGVYHLSPLVEHSLKRFIRTPLEELNQKFSSVLHLIIGDCKTLIEKHPKAKKLQISSIEDFLKAKSYNTFEHFYNAMERIIEQEYAADSTVLLEMRNLLITTKELYIQAQDRIKSSTATKNNIKIKPIISQKQQQRFFITQLIKSVQLSSFLTCCTSTSNAIRSKIHDEKLQVLLDNQSHNKKIDEIEQTILKTVAHQFPYSEINDLITRYKLELIENEKFSFIDKRFTEWEAQDKIYYDTRQAVNKVSKRRKQLQHYKAECIICKDENNKTNNNLIHFYGNVYFCLTCKTNLDKIRESIKQCKQCKTYLHLEMDEFRAYHAELCYTCYRLNLEDVVQTSRTEEKTKNLNIIAYLQSENLQLMEEIKQQPESSDTMKKLMNIVVNGELIQTIEDCNKKIKVNNEIIKDIEKCIQNDALESDIEEEENELDISTDTAMAFDFNDEIPPLPTVELIVENKAQELSNSELDFTLGREDEPLFPECSVNNIDEEFELFLQVNNIDNEEQIFNLPSEAEFSF